MYDPYNLIKRHFSQKILCYHVYHIPVPRSNYRRCSVKKDFIKNLRKFHTKAPALECLFNKVAGLKACNVIKKRLQRRSFLVKFSKNLKTPILKNICERVKAPQKNKSIACLRKTVVRR